MIEGAANPPMNRPSFRAVKTEEHLYVRYGKRARELYDSGRDPYQIASRHDTANRELLNNLQRRLDGLRRCSGTSCLEAEGP